MMIEALTLDSILFNDHNAQQYEEYIVTENDDRTITGFALKVFISHRLTT
jgi:hypothetical protein